MKKIIFLVSGNGGNLKFIHECIKLNHLSDCTISCVIADRDCEALSFARGHNIESFLVVYDRNNPDALKTLLKKYESDLIITNIHKIIDAGIINLFKNKLINLHYSLLPSFKGLIGEVPVKHALEAHCKVIGSTVHFVEESVDEGEIISQCAFSVNEEYLFKELMKLIFKSGCLNLLNSIYITLNMNIACQDDVANIDDNMFLFSPGLKFEHKCFDKKFWSRIITY